MSTLERAIEIATEAHREQTDKRGQPYIDHPLRVMKMGRNPNEKIVGVLHGVIEDSSWTFGDIQAEDFSAEIIAALVCLTKTSETEDYDVYVERIAKDPLAIAVKIHDLTDNMDVRRLPCIRGTEMVRLNKYLKAYHRLKPDYDAFTPQKREKKTFDQIRKTHPNAYRPWSGEDDEKLERLFCEGLSLGKLIKEFGRARRGIESRIIKLELPDKYGIEFTPTSDLHYLRKKEK